MPSERDKTSKHPDNPTPNPYLSPREPSATTDRTTGKPLLAPAVISILCGVMTAFLGVCVELASDASDNLIHDDFDLFFTIVMGGSCLVWPLTLVAFTCGLVAGFRKNRFGWMPLLIGTGLSCTGIVFVVIAWR